MTHPATRRQLLLAAACLAAPAGRALAEPAAIQRPWPRKPTPVVDVPGLRLAERRGRVVLLNFWATWCEPCRSEMPSLEQAAQRGAADGLDVVAVNYRETDAAIEKFLRANPLALPVARDLDGAVAKSFAVSIFPTTVAIRRDGRAAFSVIGATDWAADPAQRWIAELLHARR